MDFPTYKKNNLNKEFVGIIVVLLTKPYEHK